MRDPSPRALPLLAVNRRRPVPLHRQIRDGLRRAILRGELRAGERVPSTRGLAEELGVSRLPVLAAYAQLTAEGYLTSRAGGGTRVAAALAHAALRRPGRNAAVRRAPAGGVSRRASRLPPFRRPPWLAGWGAFGVHQPALDAFPFALWARLMQRHSRNPRALALRRLHPFGDEEFRRAIGDHLRAARGVRCEAEQIMIVSGSQQALDLCARVLCDPGATVALEEPGYFGAQRAFAAGGCRLAPILVDEEGLDVAQLARRRAAPRLVYVTPSHQYPLGATLSLARRHQLLQWARTAGAWIIEDDYDGEYRYDAQPLESLQGLDADERVLYIGTFSKVMFPSLRLGYLVVPRALAPAFAAVRFAADIAPPYLAQAAMAEFIRDGHFARHIHRTRRIYRERRAALLALLPTALGPDWRVYGAASGLHLVVATARPFDDVAAAERAAARGLWVWPLSPAYLASPRPGSPPRGGPPRLRGFILGFGSLTPASLPAAVRRLGALIAG